MKKFLMYVVVLVTLLFVGYTTYYFLRNNESIYLTVGESESIYLNTDETYDLPLVWTKPYSKTKVYENIVISNTDVVRFDETTKKLVGKKGGIATITITPSNAKFGPFVFDVHVGDGTVLYPFFVQNAIQLAKIGKEIGTTWQLYQSYTLVADIDLKSYDNWTPIGTYAEPFSGTFNGGNKNITNMKITTGTEVGLFGAVSASGSITNVKLSNVIINGLFDNCGAIAGISNGLITLSNVQKAVITNEKENSNNGGIVGSMQNAIVNGEFNSFAKIDMCSVEITMSAKGNCGGIAGVMVGSIINNSKAVVARFTANEQTISFGGITGQLKNANSTTYMISVIKNSYTILSSLVLENAGEAKVGTIIGINTDLDAQVTSNTLKGIYYNSVNTLLMPVAESNTTVDVSSVKYKSASDLCKKATYENWNFDSIWIIEEDASYAQINFDEAMAEAIDVYIPGKEIASENDLKTVLTSMSTNPSNVGPYYISQNIVLDLNNAEWTTIAPTLSNPLCASIICDDGIRVLVKNFKLSGNNSSFFGYVGSSAIISGFDFENITISSTKEDIGVIATAITSSSAMINACSVKNITMNVGDNSRIIGVIAGSNQGQILNCVVNKEVESLSQLTTTSDSLTFGGIVGYNKNLVANCEVSMLNFNATNASSDASLFVGGIAGKLKGKLYNCYSYDALIDLVYNGTVYAGGVCGYTDSDSQITKCFSEGKVAVPYSNEKSNIGGITAFVSGSSYIKQSYYKSQSLVGYNVGGIASYNYGAITECYFQAEAKGMKVAGLSVFNFGKVADCYVIGSLFGMDNNARASGLVSILEKDCVVEHCFSTASFDGQGQKHAETESEFRATIEQVGKLWGEYPDCGSLTNCIIINYGDAYVKGTAFGWIKQGWIEATDDQCKGIAGNYSVFKDKAGFDQTIWTFDTNGGQGAYPTLTFVIVNPNA